jgi:hypothetical protein
MTPAEDLTPEARKQLAGELSNQLAKAIKPEPITTPMSLYRITAEMQELGELLQEVEAEHLELERLGERAPIADVIRCHAEIDAIQTQLRGYLGAEVAKVDSYNGFIKSAIALAAQIKAEEQRLYRSRKAWEAAVERVKAAAVFVMQDMGKKRLEGSHGRRLRLHPGPVSVEVTEPAAVPDEFLNFTVKMSPAAYGFIRQLCQGAPQALGVFDDAEREISLSRIKATIEAGMVCPECGGSAKSILINQDGSDGPQAPCPRCEGTGRVPGHVPGARLIRNQFHLRVE